MQLIHPIYLDVPMLVSFAAAIQGGVTFESELTKENEANKSGSGKIAGKFGLTKLFSSLFEANAETEISGAASSKSLSTSKESKLHTEASIAILLYDELLKNENSLQHIKTTEQITEVKPGSLIEIAGTIEKNAVDSVIDFIEAVSILSELAPKSPISQPNHGRRNSKSSTEKTDATELMHMRNILDKDRKRTPISNAILRCTEPKGMTAVITLRTANLRDLTLAELNKNSVRLVGKVTRVVSAGQSMSTFENYGLSLIEANVLINVFNELKATQGINTDFSEVQINGPAIQMLPLMIYV
jgi:hypothetical protein